MIISFDGHNCGEFNFPLTETFRCFLQPVSLPNNLACIFGDGSTASFEVHLEITLFVLMWNNWMVMAKRVEIFSKAKKVLYIFLGMFHKSDGCEARQWCVLCL